MWLLLAGPSVAWSQASAFCPLCIRCCSQPHLLGSLWIYLVFPLPPAPLVWGRACAVNQGFTFTLNDFLGTNHVFHLCTFYISIKMEMETAHLAVKEVGVEVRTGWEVCGFRKADGASGSRSPGRLTPFLILFTCEWV